MTSSTASQAGRRKRLPRWLIPAAGYAISIACLYWVYRGFDWKSELPRLLATDLRWVTLAVLADIAVYVCQGFRWSLLLRPAGENSVRKTIQAIYIGLFANEVLPLRSGEVIRCYLQRRWSGLPLTVVISSAILERLIDGIWLILTFYAVGFFVPLPAILIQGGRVLMLVIVILSVLVSLAMFHRHHAQMAVVHSRWRDTLHNAVDGVHAMGRARTFPLVVVLSLLYLALQVGPIYALMRGYGLDLPPLAAVVVLVVLRLGTVIPQAPGNVGSFQALTVIALHILGVGREEATGYATLLFFVITVPLWLGGFVALLATRMKLEQIHHDAHQTQA